MTPRPDDLVLVTGTAGDGRSYRSLRAVVATVSAAGSVKVWPADANDPQLTPEGRGLGKLWFGADAAFLVLPES